MLIGRDDKGLNRDIHLIINFVFFYMLLKVIIVDPKYQLNVGYIARVSENFGVEKLVFVKPRANILGKKAIMFSKHGVGLLRNANIVESLSYFGGVFSVMIDSLSGFSGDSVSTFFITADGSSLCFSSSSATSSSFLDTKFI